MAETQITYSHELVDTTSALPDDIRAKLRGLAAEQMQALSDRLLASLWPKPAVAFEDSVWSPEPQRRCACGKCYGIINVCGIGA